jgi:cytochrome c oxidase cbb3-type subunit 1
MYLTGAIIMVYNLWATVAKQPATAAASDAVPAE